LIIGADFDCNKIQAKTIDNMPKKLPKIDKTKMNTMIPDSFDTTCIFDKDTICAFCRRGSAEVTLWSLYRICVSDTLLFRVLL
jgi:hypothetical protein